MRKPLIGIAGSQAYTSTWSPAQVGARRSYIDAIIAAGGVPLLLPPVDASNHDLLDAYYDQIDGLLLPGGGDIDPVLYGAEKHPKTDNIDALRDYSELYLARKATANGKPILGFAADCKCSMWHWAARSIQDLPDEVG
jgi:putative glutamine amidotransferase